MNNQNILKNEKLWKDLSWSFLYILILGPVLFFGIKVINFLINLMCGGEEGLICFGRNGFPQFLEGVNYAYGVFFLVSIVITPIAMIMRYRILKEKKKKNN